MAIRRKKKIIPKFRIKKLYKIRIILLTALLIVLLTNSNYYTGIPVLGNLSNRGIIAEYDNDIYYIKYSDGVYRSKLLNDKKIIDGHVYSMQIAQGYLYYMKTVNDISYIERVDRYGKNNIETLATFYTNISKFYLHENYIYYVKNGQDIGIYRKDVDSQNEELLVQSECDDFQVDSGKIYYSLQNHICVINKDGSERDIIGDDYLKNFLVYKEWIYYTNTMTGNLTRINRLGTAKNVLINTFFVLEFNIYDDKIYFYKDDIGAICTVSITGNGLKKVIKVDNKYTMINITSNGDIYYLEYYPLTREYEYTRINKDGKNKNIGMNWRVI